MIETYTIRKGVMKRIPECYELRWFTSHLIAAIFGLLLGLVWQ